MKANWSCTTCGMYSGRRYCVQRHINNLHKGYGTAIPFVEYLTGRRSGWYPPGHRPTFGQKKKTLREEMKEEVHKVFVKRVAEQCLPPNGDPKYRDCVNNLKNCFYNPNSQQFELLHHQSIQQLAYLVYSNIAKRIESNAHRP